jgi:sugar lactone lactonase YvrE
VPNSLGWSPDDSIFYFADTAEKRIRRYRFDLATGALGQALAPIGGDVAGGPDGSAVDAEGYVWNTRYGAGLVVRIRPDGAVIETIEMPVTQPTACAFGGTDLKTLYITTASQRLDDAEIERQPLAGHLFQLRVEVPGLPEPAFRFRRREQT